MVHDIREDRLPLPPELRLLLALIEEGDNRDPLQLVPLGIDWEVFLALVKHHRVYPLVHSKLKRIGSYWLPARAAEKIAAEYARNTFKMLHMSREMERVCQALNDRRIPSLVLKGPVLSEYLFGDLALRTSKDLDILVPEADVEKAEAVLLGLGFELHEDVPRILNNWKRKSHHLSYLHRGVGIQVELHWRMNPDAMSEPPFEELWARRRTSMLTGCPVYFPGNEDLFFYLATHGARHGWFRLRWLCDIDRLARKPIDWHVVDSIFKSYKSKPLGGQALLLARMLLGTPLSSGMEALCAHAAAKRTAGGALGFIKAMEKPNPKSLAFIFYLLSLMNARQKWSYFKNRFYPSSHDAEKLPLPASLHFLYFPLRPFLWVWRHLNRQASREEAG